MIQAGVGIFIPRSPKGYDNLIRKLMLLKQEMSGMVDQTKYALEGEYNKHQSDRVLVDLAGDVLTLIGTTCAKALSAAQKARTAAATIGRNKAAAQYLADNAAKDLSRELHQKFTDTVVNKGLTLVDEDLGAAYKDLYVTQKKGASKIANVSAPRSLLDIADLLLDYVSPSKVADGFIYLTTGETPGQSYQEAQKHMRNTLTSSNARCWTRKFKRHSKKKN